ncbi:MAG: MotA/TolQ/ExbB proton channel family protein [Gemmataceae bacterium]|nr:MotA/TolQ/ExbB proton channel family protein [Gemmataceae bacterium]
MQLQSSGKFQQFMLSMMLSVSMFCFVGIISLITLPTPAFAQEEKKEGEPAPEEGAKQEKGKINPVVHFFQSIGWVFGMMFAVISVGMVALIIILVLDLRLGEAVPPAFVEEFTDMVNKRQFKQAYDLCKGESSYIARVLTAGMGRLQYGIEDAREAMHAMSDSVKVGKESWNSYLGVIGTLGPLLGLVGTVSGMIGAFRKLGESTKAPEASALASEISHALVVTLVGVGIAVPAIFFFTVFKNRLTGLSVNTLNLADDLLTQMYHNSKKTTGGPASPSVERASTGVQAK